MKHCECYGNSSLRSAIGHFKCECGGNLVVNEVLRRIISRLDELDEAEFRMIGALQRLGADRCDRCGEWDTHCWGLFDHCSCLKCLADDPDWPLADEGLEEHEEKEMALSIVRYLAGKGRTPPKYSGLLREAYLQIAK